MQEKGKNKVFIIGLDGASWNVIFPMIEEGKLPNFRYLMKGGTYGVLRSTIQPSSEQAWPALMSGKNNGKHGIFGFYQRKPGTYRFAFVNFKNIKAKTLWKILSERGKHVAVINVPMTYPPEEVNGVLVSGLLSPAKNSQYTYPVDLKDEIRANIGDYIIDVDEGIKWSKFEGDETLVQKYLKQVTEMIEMRTRVVQYIEETKKWDFLMVVYRAIDGISHKFWNCVESQYLHEDAATHGNVIYDFYEKIDTQIGKLLQSVVGRDTSVFIVSDHGFGRLEKSVFLNRWLKKIGLLRLKDERKGFSSLNISNLFRLLSKRSNYPFFREFKKIALKTFPGLAEKAYTAIAFDNINWSKTKAFAIGSMGNIYLNVKGREPEGEVNPGEEYDRVRNDLIHQLKKLEDPYTGQPIFKEVYKGEEIYHGDYAHLAPDIVGFKSCDYRINVVDLEKSDDEVVVPIKDKFLFVNSRAGEHDINGVFIAYGNGIRQNVEISGAEIIDVAPTALYFSGESIPKDMDGRVLTEIVTEDFLQRNEVKYSDEETRPSSEEEYEYSEIEQSVIARRLKDLGYL